MQIVSIAARLLRPMAIVAVLLGAAADADGAPAAKPDASSAPLFSLSRIMAVPVAAESAARFTVTLAGVAADDPPTFTWYLHLSPAAPGADTCNNAVLAGGTRVSPLEYRWVDQGPSFVWYQGASGSYPADRSYGCDRAAIGHSGYPGTVSVLVENEYQHCTASFAGALAGPRPEYGAAAGCALGGYSLTASLLPVPAALLALYRSFDTELAALVRRARQGGTTRAAAITGSLDAILRQQSGAYGRLFPPVWGCGFAGLFNAVVAAETALAVQVSSASLARDSSAMRGLDRALASCEQSSTSPDGALRAVVAQVGRLTAATSALSAKDGRGGAAVVAKRRTGIDASLDSLVAHEFPTVFGMSFTSLVQRTLEISVGATLAERTAGAGQSGRTLAALESILGPEQEISGALQKQQRRVVRAENKNS
jgi:hypothetical protein